jgi:hypothetical protein
MVTITMVAMRKKMVITTNALTTVTTISRSHPGSTHISDQITCSSVVQSEREGETAIPKSASEIKRHHEGKFWRASAQSHAYTPRPWTSLMMTTITTTTKTM